MLRVTWRSIRAHVKQFVLTTFAVVLGVAFLSGTLALRAVMSDTFSALTASTFTADLYLTGRTVGDPATSSNVQSQPIDASLAQEAQGVEGVETANPGASMPGVLVGADGAPVTTGGAPTLFIPLFEREPGLTWVEGRRPAGAEEIALESGALERSGLKIGDTTHVVLQGRPMEVTVVGELSYGTTMAGASIIGMDGDWLVPMAAPDGKISSVSISVADGAETGTVKESLAQMVPDGVEVRTRAEMIDETNAFIERILGFVQTFLLVFVVLAMFVGSFIIMNSFAMSVRQRVREFALLRAVGASPGSVFGVVFCQALVIGIVGSALGVVVGAGLLKGLVALLDAMGMPLTDGVPMTPAIIAMSMVVGILVTVVGALMPAREAATTHPVEAMRGVSGAREKPLVVRTVIGALVLAGGAAAVAAAWAGEELDQRRLVLGLGAAGILLGLLVVSPVLARPVVGVIGLPFRLLRPAGRLAVRNIVHNPRRTANTSGALMVGMALVCAGATIAASVNSSVSDEVNTSMRADLLIQPASGAAQASLSPQMVQQINELEQVASTTGFTAHSAAMTRPDGTQAVAGLAVVDPTAYSRSFDPRMSSGSLSDLDQTHVIAFEGSELALGETVTLTGSNGTVQATVAGIADPRGVQSHLYVSPDTAAAVGSLSGATPTRSDEVLDSPMGLFVTLEPGADLEAVRDRIQDIVAPTYVYQVMDHQQVSDQIGQSVNQTLGILYALLGLSIAIAILGIVNTLVLSVAERTREIGLMRAVGLGKSQLAGEIMVESVLTALYGTVLGGATGIILAAALRKVLEDDGLTSLTIPWGQLVAMLVISVIVGLIAALWPALRASRLPVLEAIATE
ncbi:ABC transporter permease [Actinomyces bowdenii]|uniref:ABC transporter permease n=1 Tax=Actinomyces bowdenii TaxID=131109 RepID=A0A3P1VBL6_9ACTO|nr:ABC transporter permease [Actinomyces bowdenii]RRD30890.1 ABC transporter permease [Actinomyces bowdenii]